MAFYKYPQVVANHDFFQQTERGNVSIFDLVYSPGARVPYSGIYRCESCGQEAACNRDDHFPPHNPACRGISWRLIVATDAVDQR